jgi:hypothetical protein
MATVRRRRDRTGRPRCAGGSRVEIGDVEVLSSEGVATEAALLVFRRPLAR